MKYLCGLLCVLCLALTMGFAAAEDVFVIDADRIQPERLNDKAYLEEKLTAPTQYISVVCDLGDEKVPVRLTVSRKADGKTVHQKSYGQRKGVFRSDDIYLKYSGSGTAAYDIILSAGEKQWQFPFYRKLMKLSRNTACSYGLRVRDAAPGVTKGWPMATVIDTQKGGCTVPLCASDQYVIGTVDIRISGDKLAVTANPFDGIGLTVHSQRVYAVTDPGTLTGLDEKALRNQYSFKPGQSISISRDLNGSRYVIIYLAMEVSYDPNGLETFDYSDRDVVRQLDMWQKLLDQSLLENNG